MVSKLSGFFQMTAKDIHYAFFGKSAHFRLVVRNGFAHFVRKVFARGKMLPGKFWVFAPLPFSTVKLEKVEAFKKQKALEQLIRQ